MQRKSISFPDHFDLQECYDRVINIIGEKGRKNDIYAQNDIFSVLIKNQLHKILERIPLKQEYEGSDIADKIFNQLQQGKRTSGESEL